ncbi:YeiH family protein [Flavobacterium sp. UBA6135]|uniref:YeiH family protein n=1 Tax=Flavobacterium sp. UBA6135 TaxID=1946553 RepID=UPI0025BC2B56|nr:putative sulfate exporter family transporter [Flavobacterium sp. UBA6135]
MENTKNSLLSGILFSVFLAAVVLLLVHLFSALNAIVLGLLLGILVGNIFTMPTHFQPGIGFIGNKMLELSIIFLAFGINYTHMGKLGWESFLLIGSVVFILLILTVYLAKKLNCPSSVGWLVGFGTTICGSSAIAALAPSVSKNKEDVGVAVAVVNFYGTLGMLIMPLLLAAFSFSTLESSLLLGGSLHSVGNVAGAGYAMSSEIGEQALTIKLARVALLSPGLIFFSYLTQKNTGKHWKHYFQLPWYLWGFLFITVVVSLTAMPTGFITATSEIGKVILTIAMTAIGLKVSFRSLIQSGKRGMVFGLLIFVIQIVLLGLGIWFFVS